MLTFKGKHYLSGAKNEREFETVAGCIEIGIRFYVFGREANMYRGGLGNIGIMTGIYTPLHKAARYMKMVVYCMNVLSGAPRGMGIILTVQAVRSLALTSPSLVQ